jgi:hypothetical protein
MKSDPVPLAIICQSKLCLAEILIFVRLAKKGTSGWKLYCVRQFEVTTFGKNAVTGALKRAQTFWATHLCKNTTFMRRVPTLVRETY